MVVELWAWGQDIERPRCWSAAGEVLAIPSESSYGLAVDPGNPRAVERVYGLKERERGKPLPVVAADLGSAAALVDAEHPLFQLAAGCWPAALTVVIPSRRRLAAAAGGATLAIRVPAHAGLRRFLDAIGSPLTATSANRAGQPPILDPAELGALLEPTPGLPPPLPGSSVRAGGREEPPDDPPRLLVIDDGVLPGGAPSTLVDWHQGAPRLLRPGAFPFGRLIAPGG